MKAAIEKLVERLESLLERAGDKMSDIELARHRRLRVLDAMNEAPKAAPGPVADRASGSAGPARTRRPPTSIPASRMASRPR